MLFFLASSAVAGGPSLFINPLDNREGIELRWDQRMLPIKWNLSSDGYPNTNTPISEDEIIAEMQAAFDTWSNLETSNVSFEFDGVVDNHSAGVDGQQLITFTDSDFEFSAGVVGLAVVYFFSGETTITDDDGDLDGDGIQDIPTGTYAAGTIYDGNILFKSELAYSVDGADDTVDLRSVALHEVGHFIGLSHSSIEEASMYPFLNSDIDIEESRKLSTDDIAYVSKFYPEVGVYESTFGEIVGTVLHGKTNSSILGAHVYAVDPETGNKVVGAYTNSDGDYTLPIPAGSYYIGIEPLDGDPIALDPQRINPLIANTLDTGFAEELYDANESSIETDAFAAIPVDVSVGAITDGINLRTNLVSISGGSYFFFPGINYFSFPVSIPDGLTAFQLLAILGDDSQINAIDRFNTATRTYERASYLDGVPAGIDFEVKRGEGYLVHATEQQLVYFSGSQICVPVSFGVGVNLIAIPCPPTGFSAYDLLRSSGSEHEIKSLRRYNHDSGEFDIVTYVDGEPSGLDFPIVNGEAYLIDALVAKTDIDTDGSSGLFPPEISGISPGRGLHGELVSILGYGFSENLTENTVYFNGELAFVLSATSTYLLAVVPDDATSGDVYIDVNGKTSNTIDFIVETSEISETNIEGEYLLSGQDVLGQLLDSSEQDRYTFIGFEGDLVSIDAEAQAGSDADLLLILEGIGGIALATDDDSGSGNNPQIKNFKILETGIYTIVVTTVPGSAVGGYRLSLDIVGTSNEPGISLLGGAVQTAVAGTDLPQPFELYVTGAQGVPIAGVPVTLTASNIGLPSSTDDAALAYAGSTVIHTNGSGIALIQATAPMGNNDVYDVIVTVPGMDPVTIEVSTIAEPIGGMIVSGQNQDCGGDGCPVNTALEAPYSIRYFDINGDPLDNVFTQWRVVAGSGSITDYSPSEIISDSGKHLSDENGETSVNHVLGTTLYMENDNSDLLIKEPQAVIAFVSGQTDPVLFTAESKAGDPATIESTRSGYVRMMYNTIQFSALRVKVTDEYGNLVAGAPINVNSGSIQVVPGILNGEYLTDFTTNEQGLWVGAVSASQIQPTIDEFNNSSAPGLASPYSLSLNAGSTNSISYTLDVDLGPRLLSSISGQSEYITQTLNDQIVSFYIYKRSDSYEDVDEDGIDDDNGLWTDEEFSSDRLSKLEVLGQPIEVSTSRLDGKDVAALGLQPSQINGQDKVTLNTSALREAFGEIMFDVSMGDVGGVLDIIFELPEQFIVQHVTDKWPIGTTGYYNAREYIGEPVLSPQEYVGRSSASIIILPIEIDITIDANEFSNLDWTTLNIWLNGTTSIFDANNPITLNTFPNYVQIYLGGSQLTSWPTAAMLESAIGDLRIVYQPTGAQLIDGNNTVDISAATSPIQGVGESVIQEYSTSQDFVFGNSIPTASWDINWVLDEATPTEIANISFTRTYFTDKNQLVDSFEEIFVLMETDGALKVELLDGDLNVIRALVDEASISADSYRFVLSRQDFDEDDIYARVGTDFHILITKTPADPRVSPTTKLYLGELESNITSETLGQIIQHDTLLQRGSLSLRREDISLMGVGPQLNFIRNYSNVLRAENKLTNLSDGWTHNHNMFVKVNAYSDGEAFYGNHLPNWIKDTRDTVSGAIKLLTPTEYESIQSTAVVPSIVTVSNGGTFEYDFSANIWVPQRGYHGTLTQQDYTVDGETIGKFWVYTSKDGTQYNFEPAEYNNGRHYIENIKDRNGNTLSYFYKTGTAFSDLRRIDYIVDQTGRFLQFDYITTEQGENRLATVEAKVMPVGSVPTSSNSESLDIVLTFDYYDNSDDVSADILGMLKSFARDDFVEEYTYALMTGDTYPNLTSVTDPRDQVTYYTYYEHSAASSTDVARYTQLNYFAPGINPYDLVHKICYPILGGNSSCNTEYAEIIYDTSSSNTRKVIDLRGYTTTYTFNNYGNPKRIEEPEDKITEFEWSIDLGEADNVMRTKRDVSTGASWSYAYDAKGNLIEEIDPFGKTTEQVWDQDFSVLTYRKDKNGNELTIELDDKGNVLTEERDAFVNGGLDSVKAKITHTYDSFSTATNKSAGYGLRLSTTVENASGDQTTAYGYDVYGNLDTHIAPLDALTSYVNDPRGRLQTETDPSGNITSYEYDNLDRTELITDAVGNTTTYVYDAKGNKINETITETYKISLAEEHALTTNIIYSYDARDRVSSMSRTRSSGGVALPGGSRVFTYDGNSNLTSETGWRINTTMVYTYDELNRRLTTTNPLKDTMREDYVFVDGLGLQKTITDYNGNITIENYDLLDRLHTIKHPLVNHIDGETAEYQRTITYDNLQNIRFILDENGNTTEYVYDPRNLKVEQINANGDSYYWHYDEAGNNTATIDEEERVTEYVYDTLNRLTDKKLPEDRVWTYTYYDNGNTKTVTDPWLFEKSFTYNGVNQRTSMTTPSGIVNESYTKGGLLTWRSDAEDRTESHIYDDNGNTLASVDARGRTTTYSYDADNNLLDTVLSWDEAPSGPVSVATHYVYDLANQLTSMYQAYGSDVERLSLYEYDAQGNRIKVTLPDDRVTGFEYDELHRNKRIISAQVDSLEQNTDQIFDGLGNLRFVINRRGYATENTYDKLNRLETVIDAKGNSETYSYDKVGNLRFSTDRRHVTTETLYDGVDRVSEVYVDSSAANDDVSPKTRFRLQQNEYDPSDCSPRCTAVTDANGNRVVNIFDWRGNSTEVILPSDTNAGFDSASLINAYDNSGFLESSIDASGFQTAYTYYADGTVASVTNAENETHAYAYDIFANQVEVIKPRGEQYVQTSTYDALSQLRFIENANGDATRFDYDANGNLRHQYMPAANDSGTESHVEYIYDALNRKREHIQYKGTGNLTSRFTYDAEGNLTGLTDANQKEFTYTYDELDRLDVTTFPANDDISTQDYDYDNTSNVTRIREVKTAGTEDSIKTYDHLNRLSSDNQRGHLVSYVYDNNGNREQVTAPGGSTDYAFDTRNRLFTVTIDNSETRYSYLQNGWLQGVEHANSTSVAYTYYDSGRVHTITNALADQTLLSSFEYEYDDNGNRTKQIEIQNGFVADKMRTTDYTYDILDRLESYTHDNNGVIESHSFSFYPSYDRHTQTVVQDGITVKDRTYTYDETYWLNTIAEDASSGGSITYTYDNNGNTLSKADTTVSENASTVFTYNTRNQLKNVASGNIGTEISRGEYDYNYAGMRIRHLGSERGDIEYIYDDQSIIDEVLNRSTTQVAHYRYGDRLLSLATNAGEQFYHYASLGTTANLSNSNGENQIAYRVDPFGDITHQEGESENRQVFTGQEHDEQTGLIYFGARFYDPDVARFINQDSYLGESNTPPSLHRYLYAYSNPTYYKDWMGYCSYSEVNNIDCSLLGATWEKLTGSVSDAASDVVDLSIEQASKDNNALVSMNPTPFINLWHILGFGAQVTENNPDLLLAPIPFAKPFVAANKVKKSPNIAVKTVENKKNPPSLTVENKNISDGGETFSGKDSFKIDLAPNKINSQHLDLITSHPNAHSIARHGGDVRNDQLMHRALTGVAPDGHAKVVKGKTILPPMSSAFHSDDLLVYADQAVRNNGALQAAIAQNPGKSFVTVKPADVGDLGSDLGRGFQRISGSKLKPELQGAPNFVENLRSVQATYEFNQTTKAWETITIFPSR